ncbi:MAG: hypothetical protein J5775_04075 [Spirochaetales bacterium]|nr:hypothetical protein [Spirochaetales bacterium]
MSGFVKRLSFVMVLMVFCGGLACAQTTVRTFFPATRTGSSVLPVDSVIGQTADSSSSQFHLLVAKALRSEYSYEWTQKYIREDVRAALIRLFGDWLSANLPAKGFLLSVLHTNADGSVGINIRVGETCLAVVVADGQIVSMTRL